MTREPSSLPRRGAKPRKRDEIKAAIDGLKTLRQARLFFIMYFCYGAGVEVVVPNLGRFIKTATHCSDYQSQMMFSVLMIFTAIGSLFGGWLCDRIGAKKLLIIGIALIAAAAMNGLWVNTLPEVALVLAIAGLGTAAQNGSAYPLLAKLVPCEEIGFYTGLQTTALSIAGPLSLFLTGLLINQHGYRVIFGVCTSGVAIAIIVLLQLHLSKAPKEIEARNLEQGRLAIPA